MKGICTYMFLTLSGPFANWLLANLALLLLIGVGLLEYTVYGRQKKEREEAQENKSIAHAQYKVNKKRVLTMLKSLRRLAKEYDLRVKFAPKIQMLEREVNQVGPIQENLQTFWNDKAKEIQALTRAIEVENQEVMIRTNKSASLFFSCIGTLLFVLRSTPSDLAPFSLAKLAFWFLFVLVLYFLLYVFSRLFYARLFNRSLIKLSILMRYISSFSRFFVIYAVIKIFMFTSVGLSMLYYSYAYINAFKLLFPTATIIISAFPSVFIIVGEFIAVVIAYIEAYKFLKNAFSKKKKYPK